MPIGEGWWLAVDGRVLPVYEHLQAVENDPREFGLAKALLAAHRSESEADRRERILTEVTKKGWIRVRFHGGHVSFDTWFLTPDVADAIFLFTADVLGPVPSMRVGEVSTGKAVMTDPHSFFEDVKRRNNPRPGNRLYLFCRAFGMGRKREVNRG